MAFIKPQIPIDGDNVELDYTPTNYTPNDTGTESVDNFRLAAHLNGINTALATGTGGDVSVIYLPFTISTSSPQALGSLVSGDIVMNCEISILVGFSDAASVITVGTPANNSAVMSASEIAPTAEFTYRTDENYLATGSETLNLYILPGSSIIGSGYVLLMIKN